MNEIELNSNEQQLAELRNKIDQIDDSILSLLIERTNVSKKIGQTKNNTSFALRHAREAQIMRRLWGKSGDSLDKDTMIRIWREIISSSVNLQTQMNVAVFVSERGKSKTLELAKPYFGTKSAYIPCRSINMVFKMLETNDANVGIVSLNEDSNCWWYALSHDIQRILSVFVKLPITNTGIKIAEGNTIFGVSKMPFESSGNDRSLLVVETDGTISLSTLDLLIKSVGLPTNAIYDTFAPDMMRKAYLFEIDEYINDEDNRLLEIKKKSEDKVILTKVIGGFPAPLEQL
ncbi:MAG: chorismate mutase [Alphaproteobacteria bacterium]|nr:chorismate mutase [Alphaproteobacteria bacterium]